MGISKAFDREKHASSFEHYLKRSNAWGVPIDVLPRLLRKDVFGDAVEQIVEEVREDVTRPSAVLGRPSARRLETPETKGLFARAEGVYVQGAHERSPPRREAPPGRYPTSVRG